MSDNVKDMTVNSRTDFVRFVGLLRQELRESPEDWENISLPAYLEALEAYAEALPQVAINTHQSASPEVPTWQLFANILLTASIYE